MTSPSPRPRTVGPAAVLLVLAVLLAACSSGSGGTSGAGGDDQAVPAVGECRDLEAADVARSSDDTDVVSCRAEHTAETLAVGRFPAAVAAQGYDAQALGRYLYPACEKAFLGYLDGDESAALRSLFSWAWFRPSEAAWKAGAHWYRCDLVGGPEGAGSLQRLPTSARGYLTGSPTTSPHQEWTLCARGTSFEGSAKVPCSSDHDWRAVTTIKLAGPRAAYPGDRVAEVRSQDYCSDSVRAYLAYPVADFDFATTVLGRAEWQTGNRRSICWARTTT